MLLKLALRFIILLLPLINVVGTSGTTIRAENAQLLIGQLNKQIFINQLLEQQQRALSSSASVKPSPQVNRQQINRRVVANNSTPSTLSQDQVRLKVRSTEQRRPNATHLQVIKQRWHQMEDSIGESLEVVGANLKQILDELLKNTPNVSTACKQTLESLLDGLRSHQVWATHLLDASARLPAGLLEGTLTELGNFDQCLAIKDERSDSSGQYCSIQVKPPLMPRPRLHTVCQQQAFIVKSRNQTMAKQTLNSFLVQNSQQFHYAGLRLGLCTPSKCTRADVQLLLSSYLSKYELIGQVKSCQTSQQVNEHEPLSRFDLTQQCILLTFFLVLVTCSIGTLLDFMELKREPTIGKEQRDIRTPTSSLSAVTSTTDDTMESLRLKLSPKKKNIPLINADKRLKHWQYQVCPSHSSLLSPQQNPLASQKPEELLVEQNLKPGRRREIEDYEEEDSYEEAWIAELEAATLSATTAVSAETTTHDKQQVEKKTPIGNRNEHGTKACFCLKAEETNKFREFFICFSIRKNLKVIGNFGKKAEQINVNDDIKVIHGIRTITMVWIIFGHTVGLVNPEMLNNLFSLATLSCSSRLLQALLNATLAVNTFFMISGLVTVISFARRCKSGSSLAKISSPQASKHVQANKKTCAAAAAADKTKQRINEGKANRDDFELWSVSYSSLSPSESSNKCLNLAANHQERQKKSAPFLPSDFQPILWILMRYVRLSPTYASVIGITILMPTLGSGPFWQELINPMAAACRQRWWHNMAYVNNFIDTDKLCLIHSWYLSNDWQFFLLTLLLFGLFYKSKKLTLLVIIILIFGSSAMTFAITVAEQFPPTIVTTSPAVAERWQFIYTLYYKPWPHLASYLIGLITGYFILIRDQLTKTSALWRTITWILFSLIAIAVLNSIYPWNMGLQVDPLLTGVHSATFRTLWAAACAYFIFGLVSRPQNSIARLLAWNGFQLTSRLTYCAYLVHPLVIYYHFGTLRERMDSSAYGTFHRFIATLGLSYLCALLLSIFIESPSIQVQRFLANLALKTTNRGPKNESPKRGESATNSSWTMASSFNQSPAEFAGKQLENNSTQRAAGCDNRSADRSQEPKAGQNACAGDLNKANIGLDADFQRKLAQAISRGFRLRSRIANGTIKQLGANSRRANQIKRIPLEFAPPAADQAMARAGAAHSTKRSGELRTFAAPAKRASCCASDVNLNELILVKQKLLLSRSQSQTDINNNI